MFRILLIFTVRFADSWSMLFQSVIEVLVFPRLRALRAFGGSSILWRRLGPGSSIVAGSDFIR